ncbi:MAG: hypothetical protein MJZ20_09495 [Bacteroidaceae bacterium]|nr:hypothetical protein [Bacteroidaceae bacterium]
MDDYFKTKENIISIECIPDGDLATDGSKYPCLKNGGTTSSDDSVFAATIDMPGFHNWAISKDENGWPYGFVLSKERAITTREWHVDLPNSTDWEYSGAYNTYSLKFNPFGTFDIPADEVLATSNGRVYFKINHSIITGQAQLLYTTGDKTQGAWKVLGETNLNYQIPYIAKQDVGSLF